MFVQLCYLSIFLYGLPQLVAASIGSETKSFALQAAEKKKGKKRRAPALRERIYSQLSQAQKLADEKKVQEGLAILKKMESKVKQLNSYEIAMMYNFMAFIYYAEGQRLEAIAAFEKVIGQKNIPESLELSTLYSLSQIYMQSENYDKSIKTMKKWITLNESGSNSKSESLLANAYYAKKDYAGALTHLEKAIEFDRTVGKLPTENQLVLKRAVHYELK